MEDGQKKNEYQKLINSRFDDIIKEIGELANRRSITDQDIMGVLIRRVARLEAEMIMVGHRFNKIEEKMIWDAWDKSDKGGSC